MDNNLHESVIKSLKKIKNKEELSKQFEVLNKFSEKEFEELLFPLMLYCFWEGKCSVATDLSVYLSLISE